MYWDRYVDEAYWLASLAKSMSCRFWKRVSQKIKVKGQRKSSLKKSACLARLMLHVKIEGETRLHKVVL